MDTKNIANEIQKYLPENRCKYFRKEEATTYHGDVFDHPSYRSYCVKNGEKRINHPNTTVFKVSN